MRWRLCFALVLLLASCETARQPSRAVKLDVPFAAGSWAATPATRPVLETLAAALRDDRLSGARFLVRVAVSPSGDPAADLTLSRLRAAAVVDGLVERGVSRGALDYDGLGSDAGGARVEVIALR